MIIEFGTKNGTMGVRLDLIEMVVDETPNDGSEFKSVIHCEDEQRFRSTEPAAAIIARINQAESPNGNIFTRLLPTKKQEGL